MRGTGDTCQARELRVLCLGMWMKGHGCQRRGSKPSEDVRTCSALCRTSEGLATAPGRGVKMGLWQLEVLLAKQNQGQAEDTDFRNSYMEKIIV